MDLIVIVPEYEIVSDGVCGLEATTHYLENEDKTNGLKRFQRERYLSGESILFKL